MPRSPKGRAVARGLDAHLHLQHAFMLAGYASLKIAQVNQKCRLTVITVSTANTFTVSARLPLRPQLPTYRCVALSDVQGQQRKFFHLERAPNGANFSQPVSLL